MLKKDKENPKKRKREEFEKIDNFFNGLKFSKNRVEDLLASEREVCCEKSRRYYCCYCMKPLPSTKEFIPEIKELPLKLVVIHHPQEHLSKSTAIHSKVIAGDNVEIVDYPEIPDYITEENTILLFPSQDAKDLKEIFCKNGDKTKENEDNKEENNPSKIKYVIFIDSTWNQCKRIFRLITSKFPKMIRVKINNQETKFWRYQHFSKNFLSTIEAIYYFYKEFHEKVKGKKYNGEFDDLLFLFKFQYDLIQSKYVQSGNKFKRIEGYVNHEKKKRKTEEKK